MWWLPGIFRDVALQAAPAGGIQDVVVQAGWRDGAVLPRVDAVMRDGAVAVVDVPSLGLVGLEAGRERAVGPVPGWRGVGGVRPRPPAKPHGLGDGATRIGRGRRADRHRGARRAARVRSSWTSDGDAVRLDVDARPTGEWPSGWARFGLEALLPWSPTAIEWDGFGPGQRYPDTGQSQRLGRWHVDGAAALHTDSVKPQENGSRAGVVRMALAGPGGGLVLEGEGLAVTVSPWTAAELDAAAHPTDLPPAGDRCRLVVDLAEHGIGTASCGPGVLPQHRLGARPVRGSVVLRPLAG